MSKPVRKTPAILAPVATMARDLTDIARNPVAMLGGLFGMLLTSTALLIGLTVGGHAHAEDDSETVELEFLPGELVRKGPKLDPKDLPDKIVVVETVAADQASRDSVTSRDDEIKPPKNTTSEDNQKPSTEAPDPNKHNVKKATKNTDSNTPDKNTPPTHEVLPGDPFASPQGWSDMAKDGDPWATAVMGALNDIKPPSFAGLGKPGTFQFRITVCPNGTIQRVQAKSSTGDRGYDAGIKNEIERVKIPKPPPQVAAQLKGTCKRIPYVFSYGSNHRIR